MVERNVIQVSVVVGGREVREWEAAKSATLGWYARRERPLGVDVLVFTGMGGESRVVCGTIPVGSPEREDCLASCVSDPRAVASMVSRYLRGA